MMTWDDFWTLIDLLGDRCRCDYTTPLAEALAELPPARIVDFEERLAEALYRLDRREFGVLPVIDMSSPGKPFPQSDDSFLYSRCAVVAAGRAEYEAVLADPARFAPHTATTLHGEDLLHLAEEAYEEVTGEEWDVVTAFDYESCSNEDGWPEQVRQF
ncbi:hypothetical protein GCM10018781_75740 [Kitasatospora indigofera]|uniref:DUF4240 domain-containing protein n=1 Tax=Kitasatospora indigofera TaxID=67307 RepID=A0A919D935_9ACTN|nr:DUF4240 domain-containing protein [Kitasatospora indigofera]GHE24941.1 hypothetical protein GCM10018781_75740 [Kitasatospora indigofera]